MVVYLTQYQKYALGFDGQRGVLSFIPQMVQNGWEECAKTLKTAAAEDHSVALRDKHGAFHDSVGFITYTCMHQADTKLADSKGRAVQAVMGNILTEQLKAFAFLTAAWGNSTVGQSKLELAVKGIEAIAAKMAGMWGEIANPALVDSTANTFLSLHAETLGAGRRGRVLVGHRHTQYLDGSH